MLYNPQLETFLCVVEAGSFSKAAEKLFITAPAVIKQINSLESSLNLQLFDRTHRGLIVTEAGVNALADFIKEIGLLTSFPELGIPENVDLKEIADSCNLVPGSYKKMTHEEVLEIFQECM